LIDLIEQCWMASPLNQMRVFVAVAEAASFRAAAPPAS
jgi:hypothetical protein